METQAIINETAITAILESTGTVPSPAILDLLDRARDLKGLSLEETAMLMQVTDPEVLEKLYETARYIKETIYGRRLVLFAPLYVSNLCANECLYCAFRARNKAVHRRSLTQEEIRNETRILVEQGHKRVLLVSGEAYPREGFDYILKAVDTVYATKSGPGEIRRVNVNVAPLTDEEFRRLKAAEIGTYQIFQETYHWDTYHRVHVAGKKRDYNWRITALDRAMNAGIDDVGIGVLYGLHDWKFETLALFQHIKHLETTFGVGPHTISVPRLEPATGSDMASAPPHEVSDDDFRKIIAIMRVAVPYTGIILSTRETVAMRRESFALGVSQISAGSRTNPGGYAEDRDVEASQFSLGDHRPLDEVIRDVASMGYVPSFCTGCYRLGRTGQDFMDMAKPGDIKCHCDPNALSTFEEYLLDYGSMETREIGEKAIAAALGEMTPAVRKRSETMLAKVTAGKRDVFC
ncbi:[FeFe] hydrogenase H-cluster radical SAM maturase HydG [bacterium]|nr:[FeFe] hydrogenase H-cluster radical SAM maturase HydG [bacterium]